MGDLRQDHTKVFKFCSADKLDIGERYTRDSRGRKVTVIRLSQNEFVAFDSLCYHMAGQLGDHGDIEDYNGATCLTCPSHKHRINLRDGTRMDVSETHPDYGRVVQRVFKCWVDPSDRMVNVALTATSSNDPAAGCVPSDMNNLPWITGLNDPNTPAGARGNLASLSTYNVFNFLIQCFVFLRFDFSSFRSKFRPCFKFQI